MVANVTSQISGLMTETQYIIVMESCYIVWGVLSLIGVASNIINIRTFAVMGLNDGVAVSFFALAIFDLAYVIASLALAVCCALFVCELNFTQPFSVDPFACLIFCGTIMVSINITNTLATTYLAVARCMCVARPLQFKNTFTTRRAILCVVGFVVFAFAIYTPILANMGIVVKFDKLTNISRPSLWMSPNREAIKNSIWMVTDMILPVVTQFVIIVCVVLMANSLRSASKFRQYSMNVSINHSDKRKKKTYNDNKNIVSENNASNIPSDKLTGKELRVVQQVVLISMVYVVCNVPKILITFFTVMEPEFSVGRRYTRLYLSVNCLRKHFEIVNSAVNLIIYYKYNTKFRSTLNV